jgi:hypothetical protein
VIWYNNPDMVKAIHEQMTHERMRAVERRRLLRLVIDHEEPAA